MVKKIKVLHVTNLYPSAKNIAFGIFIKEQIRSLENIGIKCGVLFVDANSKGKLQYLKNVSAIRKQAKLYDIIHCHHTYTAFVVTFLARVSQPIVTSFLGPGGKEGKSNNFFWLKKKIYDYVVNRSTAFIVKNDPQCDSHYPGVGHYIPNGVDLNFFNEISRFDAVSKLKIIPKKYILFCSSDDHLRPEKRYDIFKETVRIVRDKYNHDADELILSNAPRDVVPFFFNASRVHLITSDYEGSPNSVKEALACNIPVVSTNVGNVKLMIDGLKGCHISNNNDPKELAMLVNDSLKHERTEGHQRLVHLELDMESTARKIEQIYKKILLKTGQ